ncbi:MAG: SDR family oxidoreductase [Planctomycetota bacterium]|jgi:NAD(P)-dependent dehydrogenase (short-subunit alcohol dehydrogenase family)|nr:SDR family oxidoreductase [Planctomycetota bacterium]
MEEGRKTAVITGGGNGIGRETALLFLAEGFNVVIAGRRENTLRETLRLAGSTAERGLAVETDITKPAAVKRLFAAATDRFSRVDFLFNNAGLAGTEASGTPLLEISYENWRRVIDTNVTGTFLCAQEAVRIMIGQNPQGGRIVNNGSVAAQSPRAHSAPYAASKSAISGLTKSISLDFRRYNIACGQIDIGNAATEQASRHAKGALQGDGEVRAEALMSVKDVARALLFMARLPLEANVQHMTILATQMPFVGRG